MDKFFKISERNSTVKTEVMAGFTIFMSMVYILAVNPMILADSGMDINAAFTATALTAALGTLIMGLYANFPIAQAPGMGINAFFSYTMVLVLGYSWEEALFGVFVSGIIFLGLAMSGLREQIINAIPKVLKYAVSTGIGFFIAFIGLKNAGIIVANPATFVGLGDISTPSVLMAIIGIGIVLVLLARNTKGAIFISMVSVIVLQLIYGFATGEPVLPTAIVAPVPSIAPVFGKLFTVDMVSLLTSVKFWTAVLSVLFIDFFDTAGSLVAVGTRAGFVNDEGQLIDAEKALLSDAMATTVGAVLGTSSVTSYIESLTGVEEGARTGLTAVVTSILFIVALFFSPFLVLITPAVTAPALIGVGVLMAGNNQYIDFTEFTEAAAAFITIIMMLLTYSIAEGMSLGFITYVIIKVSKNEGKDVSPMMYGLSILFLIRYVVMFLS